MTIETTLMYWVSCMCTVGVITLLKYDWSGLTENDGKMICLLLLYLSDIILTINTCVHPRYVYIFDVMMDDIAYLYMTCLCCIVVLLCIDTAFL